MWATSGVSIHHDSFTLREAMISVCLVTLKLARLHGPVRLPWLSLCDQVGRHCSAIWCISVLRPAAVLRELPVQTACCAGPTCIDLVLW